MTTYKITIVMTADSHPRKWLFETIDQVMDRNQNEDILKWQIEEVEAWDVKSTTDTEQVTQ